MDRIYKVNSSYYIKQKKSNEKEEIPHCQNSSKIQSKNHRKTQIWYPQKKKNSETEY